MNMRKLTSLTALTSFVLLILTSVILYIVPHGRVAYWANWKLWGLSKTEWTNTHVTLGVLFLLAIGLHIYYNWKPITNYLKNKAKQMQVFTAEFTVALALVFVTFVGTLFHVPPFAQIISISESIKDAASLKYGEPPYGHAELSTLTTFAHRLELDLDQSLQRLRDAGVSVEGPGQILEEIALNNNLSPQAVYEIMHPAEERNAVYSGGVEDLPDRLPPGSGNLPLSDLAEKYSLDVAAIEAGLEQRGLAAKADQTLKQIGEANGMAPLDVYLVIRELAQGGH